MRLSFLIIFFFPLISLAGLKSPIPSSIPQIHIPNAHVLFDQKSNRIFAIRGMAPTNQNDYQELITFGVTDILIFKKETANEVTSEIIQFNNLGINNVTHIPFLWKDFTDFASPCEMTINAMNLVLKNAQHGRKTFFHCTVGEDRTGYLAGLILLWTTPHSVEQIFKSEMCEKGYGSGNPFKNRAKVVSKIDEYLTPLFLKMSYLVLLAKQNHWLLNSNICNYDFEQDQNFISLYQSNRDKFYCSGSSRIQQSR